MASSQVVVGAVPLWGTHGPCNILHVDLGSKGRSVSALGSLVPVRRRPLALVGLQWDSSQCLRLLVVEIGSGSMLKSRSEIAMVVQVAATASLLVLGSTQMMVVHQVVHPEIARQLRRHTTAPLQVVRSDGTHAYPSSSAHAAVRFLPNSSVPSVDPGQPYPAGARFARHTAHIPAASLIDIVSPGSDSAPVAVGNSYLVAQVQTESMCHPRLADIRLEKVLLSDGAATAGAVVLVARPPVCQMEMHLDLKAH